MSSASLPARSQITLDQLIALNDEILALSRCGVPLEKGLFELSRDLPGRLGRLSGEIAARMERGENLADVLAASKGDFPPVYRAVVEAGLRSGRLSVALEGLATSARRVAELRRMVGLALVYPLLVLTLACGLFAFVVPRFTDRLMVTYQAQRIPVTQTVDAMARFFQASGSWPFVIPLIAILAALAWWWLSRGAASAQSSRFAATTGFLPQVGRLLRVGRTATFLEMLALLVEQQLPLPEALRLAGQASGDRSLNNSAQQLAGRVEGGAVGQGHALQKSAIPPLVRWRILHPGTQQQFSAALRHAADTYGRRTRYLADWLMLYLPLLLTVVIGGTAVAVYVLAVMGPWLRFLVEMGAQL